MVFLRRTGFQFEVEEQFGEGIVLHVADAEVMRTRAEQSVAVRWKHVHTFPFGSIGGYFHVGGLLTIQIGTLRKHQCLGTSVLSIDFSRVK